MADNSPPFTKQKDTLFSMTRMRTIMKSSPEVENVSFDSLYIITKATEMFVQQMACEAFLDANRAQNLQYKNIANVVDKNSALEFLRDIVPPKITYGQYKEILKKRKSDFGDEDDSCNG